MKLLEEFVLSVGLRRLETVLSCDMILHEGEREGKKVGEEEDHMFGENTPLFFF